MTHAGLQQHIGRWYGKFAGAVVNNEHSAGLGWITVQIPTIYPDGRQIVARPCFPAGSFWAPPIGGRVWCEFEGGDPSKALWVGSWYAKGEVPPEADLQPPTSHLLHTPGGHRIELAEADGDKRITIKNGNKAEVVLDNDGTITVKAKDGNATVTLEASGSVTIEATSVEVNAPTTTISGNAEVGGAGAQAVVLQTIKTWLETHTHGSAMGPTSPPLLPTLPTDFSTTLTAV